MNREKKIEAIILRLLKTGIRSSVIEIDAIIDRVADWEQMSDHAVTYAICEIWRKMLGSQFD